MNFIKKNIWAMVALAIAIIAIIWLATLPAAQVQLGSGTRFPNGISADSTSPSAGQVRGTTLTFTGAATLSSTLGVGGLTTFDAGVLRSYPNATTTTSTSLTLQAADLAYDVVLMTPNTGAVTLTLPATSTITTLIPTAGDLKTQCWYNATSTASQTITFAAGTGMDLERPATSTTVGSTGLFAIQPQTYACFTFIRETDTDIGVLITPYIDAD